MTRTTLTGSPRHLLAGLSLLGLLPALLAASVLGGLRAPRRAAPAPPAIVLHDNAVPAGILRDGVLQLHLEVVEGSWRPLGSDRPGVPMLAFAERGAKPSIPGPLVRVPRGTRVNVTLTNPLDTVLVVHGLSGRGGEEEPLRIPAGGTRHVRFTATEEGTFFYWATTGNKTFVQRTFDSQLTGALIVDGPAGAPADRVLLLGMWKDRLSPAADSRAREFLVINGRPWPHTERLTYALGDSVRWRVINGTEAPHAMHLHGTYFRVDARGDMTRDTAYTADGRRMAATERMNPGTTMNMVWGADRPGSWIFHCHMADHVMPNPPMERERTDPRRFRALFEPGHDGDAAHHAAEGMGGLVLGVYVRPPAGWAPEEPKRRELRVVVTSKPATGGWSGRQFGYVLQEGAIEPAPDSVPLPGSTLMLRRGEPTAIRVVNRADEPTQVHWHGLELENYFDGVPGVTGYPGRLTPAIAPGDSFEVRITPPRAGTFMYHTHHNDLRQLSSGLYGAFLVLESGETWDPETDRLFVYGESPFRDDEIPILNGMDPPPPLTLRAGVTYRFRFMQITLGRPATRLRLMDGETPARWTPLAKDGYDLSPARRRARPAVQDIAVGETYDVAFTPVAAGELRLIFEMGNGTPLVTQRVLVIP